jgi:hypothetical protein
VAEFPDRIARIFVSKTKNENACYCLALCVDGIFEEIIVDDFVPYDEKRKQIIFNKTADNELWVMLLEKAWAKAYGGYDNIDGGFSRDALHDLTGAPTETFYT